MIGAPDSVTPSQSHPIGAPAPTRKWRWLRIIPLAAAVGSLVTGLWVGLARLGIAVPSGAHTLAEFHGALMISGFLGTLISLERSVAIGRWWAYTAPALSAIGAVALIVERPALAGYAFLFAGIALTFNSSVIVARQPALFTFTLAVASACWAGGTFLWINGGSVADVTGWWIAFLILTIAAERLELSRVLSPPRSSQLIFAFAAALIITGMVRGELGGAGGAIQRRRPAPGDRLAGQTRCCDPNNPAVGSASIFGSLSARWIFLAGRRGAVAGCCSTQLNCVFI